MVLFVWTTAARYAGDDNDHEGSVWVDTTWGPVGAWEIAAHVTREYDQWKLWPR